MLVELFMAAGQRTQDRGDSVVHRSPQHNCGFLTHTHTPLLFFESLCSLSLSCFSTGDSGMSSSMASSDSHA